MKAYKGSQDFGDILIYDEQDQPTRKEGSRFWPRKRYRLNLPDNDEALWLFRTPHLENVNVKNVRFASSIHVSKVLEAVSRYGRAQASSAIGGGRR